MRHATWIIGVGVGLALAAGQMAVGQTTNSQQEKMKTCNADASSHNLTGDARKSFMQKCLSHESATAATGNSQQEKMKTCNADATSKGLKGSDRKSFMQTCLSGSH